METLDGRHELLSDLNIELPEPQVICVIHVTKRQPGYAMCLRRNR